MFETFQKLSNLHQGIIYIFLGTILLLYALGFIQRGISFLVIAFSLYLLFVGLVKTGLYQKVTRLKK